eukprot:GHVN01031504.1.p1 GENE.GHVN01031504.1~~GHVN01031504.1.p1  ORF type:complete len:166 (+),score=37.26 GHVN01031504.1:1124-1621(+)
MNSTMSGDAFTPLSSSEHLTPVTSLMCQSLTPSFHDDAINNVPSHTGSDEENNDGELSSGETNNETIGNRLGSLFGPSQMETYLESGVDGGVTDTTQGAPPTKEIKHHASYHDPRFIQATDPWGKYNDYGVNSMGLVNDDVNEVESHQATNMNYFPETLPEARNY